MIPFRWVPASLFGLFVIIRSGRAWTLLSQGSTTERGLVALAIICLITMIWLAVADLPEAVTSFFRPRDVQLASLVLGAIVTLAIFAPIATGYAPESQLDLAAGQLLPPSLNHLFGTDLVSRDLFSRMVFGARVSLVIGTAAIVISISIGTIVGLTAGYVGGAVELVLMRLVDAGLAIPRIFLLLVFVALWGKPDVSALVLILGVTGWFGTSRLVRAEVLRVKGEDFVVAARGLGLAETRIALRHVLPNVVPPIIVSATLGVGQVILVEAGLSFLGLGVQQPFASWGSIIHDGRTLIATSPWIATIPGIAIALTVVGLGILGDRLQTTFNPKGNVQF